MKTAPRTIKFKALSLLAQAEQKNCRNFHELHARLSLLVTAKDCGVTGQALEGHFTAARELLARDLKWDAGEIELPLPE